jgi:pSer/pThr/pTyr-binding forkhead associated (FHA) protein
MEPKATFTDSGGPVMAYLEWTGTEAARPAVFPLHDEAVIGRDPQDALASDKFICIPEQTISRRHARIRRRGATYFIEDLHSRNGSFVLGERLAPGAWHPLRDGDELALASVQLVFHSLMLPERGNAPTVIAKSVDATQFAPPLADIRQAERSALEKSVHRLHAMAQATIALGAVTDRATLIEKIMNFIFDLFPLAERAFILLRNNERDPPAPVAAPSKIRTRSASRTPSSTKCCTRSARCCRSIPCPTATSARTSRSSPKPSAASCACR